MVVLFSTIGFLILDHARRTAAFYQQSLTDLVSVAELTRAVGDGAQRLGRLATDPSPERVKGEINQVKAQIHQLRSHLPSQTVNPASARIVLDLDAMADSFLVEAGAAVYAFNSGSMELYFKHDHEAATIAGYVRDTADRLLAAELDKYRSIYPEAIRRDAVLQRVNLLILVAVTIVATIYAWTFARGVTDPLRSLARAAGRIAGGDLDGPPVPTGSGDELQLMGTAFNHMQENLRQHVADLKGKAELEHRLQAEELENLEMTSLLREAELRALQSQVNPHFLFNTLNMVAKTALIEGAERTYNVLETVSDLLRYNLRDLERPVPLRDEVRQVERYTTIQAARFRDRFCFVIDVDEGALDTLVPRLTIQPLVENALIHGFGNREAGGEVRLEVRGEADRVLITVSDNGVGIAQNRLPGLNEGTELPEEGAAGGHTTGLGLQNVRRRVELFFGGSATLLLTSEQGVGTSVMLNLPRGEGGALGAHYSGR
jgi:sensor histidine kinase YesM